MTTYTGVWDETSVAAFLEETAVPIRLACHRDGGSLWMVSLWYRYDGAFHCATGADADVVGWLRADDRVAFEVSTNDAPYRGVRGNGRVEIAPDEDKALLQSLMERYLGGTDHELGEKLLAEEREEVHLTIEPERIYSWDFSGRMPGRDE
jgi:nitroimidazol reductase NimA-like FMN-containing flavoprotein (pyridoxamine 5'-phosphate oxidase superfamily)